MSTGRFTKGDALAVLAAFALLFVMATDWYSSPEGQELRRIERLAQPDDSLGPEARDLRREQREEASQSAEAEERNAWTADGLIDRVILLVLLATIAAALSLAISRLRQRSVGVPGGPRGLVLMAATVAAMLVVYRMVQEPGIDAVTTIRGGPFLGLVTLGLMSLGAILTLRTGPAAGGGEAVPEGSPERQIATAQAAGERADGSRAIEPAATARTTAEVPTTSAAPEAATDPVVAEAQPPPADPDDEAQTRPTAAAADILNGAAPVSYRRRLSADQRARIAEIARSDPAELGKPFARWTHARLAAHLVEEGVVDSISPGAVGRILRRERVTMDPTNPR